MLLKKILLILLYTMALHSSISIEPYFSKTSGRYYKGGVDNKIINDIKNSSTSIDMAMYYLTNRHITKALISAHYRGIKVRVVTDDKKIKAPRYKELIRANVEVVNDHNPRALMHNKILIIDKHITWIGSGNFTVYAFYRNHDNFLRIDSRDVANYYEEKFTNLFNGITEPIEPYLSKNIEIYFAPDSDIEKRLLARINHAKHSIYFLAYAFTNQKIAKALLDAHHRGVVVKGVFDKAQDRYQKYSRYRWLKSKGLSVVYDQNRFKLHDKVIIIDEKVVVTGSYNFTHKANRTNAENIMVIKSRDIAKSYIDEFKKIYNKEGR
ncbi:Endonuclease [hydrothermal vent metagenome]|uniref:Endonuclease n=1 Tax=hydrothermal vent metagenome TaxID=652676 RepID=A0A1W1CGB9_9ZZZZ